MSGRTKKHHGKKLKVEEPIMEETHEVIEESTAFPEELDEHGEIIHEIGHHEMEGLEDIEEHHVLPEETAETDTSTTRKKAKRRKTAYQFFVADNRKNVSIDNPDLTFGQTTAKLASMWRALPDDDKAGYEQKANEEQGHVEEHVEPGDTGAEPTGKKRGRKRKERKWTKDPSAPKKAVTPYILFGKAVREDIIRQLREASGTQPKPTDIMKEISARWVKLTVDEKTPFDEEAAKDKVRYEAEKKVWQASRPDEKINKRPKAREEAEGGAHQSEKRALMVRARADAPDLFDRIVFSVPLSYKQFIKKVQTKRNDPRNIYEVVQLPNIRIRDSEDLNQVPQGGFLEVAFADEMPPEE